MAFRNAAITWHTDKTTPEIQNVLKHINAPRFAWQWEKGDKTDKTHAQMYVEIKDAKLLHQWQAYFKGAHIEKAKGSKQQNVDYCSKEDTRSVGPFLKNCNPSQQKDELEQRILIPKVWQTKLQTIVDDKPDNRKIVWVWEPKGNVGKTSWAWDNCLNGTTLLFGGKCADVLAATAAWVDPVDQKGESTGKAKKLTTVIIDVPRCMIDFMSFQAIEMLKNAIFMNTKYHSRMVMMPTCHVIVFANEAPDRSKLSKDRWEVYQIINEDLVPDNELGVGMAKFFSSTEPKEHPYNPEDEEC